MESRQATSAPLSDPSSGSSHVKTSSSFDSEIQNVIGTNVFNTNTKDSNSTNSSSSSSSSTSDDGGFVSGEEEFETASERPILDDPDEEILEKGIEGEDTGDPFAGTSDISRSREEMPTSKALPDDDVKKGFKVRILGGEEVEGDGVVLEKDSGFVEESGSSSIVADGHSDSFAVDAADSKDIVVEGEPERLVGTASGENLNSNSKDPVIESSFLVSQDSALYVLEGSKGDMVAENSELDKGVNSVPEGSSVEDLGERKSYSEKAVNDENSLSVPEAKEISEVVKESAILNGDTDHVNSKTVEPADSKLLQADGVKFATEGDPLVETIHSGLSGPKVAVVGEIEQNKDVVTGVAELQVKGDMTLVNGSNQTSHVVGESVDSKLIGIYTDFGKSSAPKTNYNIESTEWEPLEKSTNVAGAERDENLNLRDVVTDKVGGGTEIEQQTDYETKQNEFMAEIAVDRVEAVSSEDAVGAEGDGVQIVGPIGESTPSNQLNEVKDTGSTHAHASALDDGSVDTASGKSHPPESAKPNSTMNPQVMLGAEDEVKSHTDEEGEVDDLVSEGETDGMIFGSAEATKQFIEELERGSGGGSHSGAESSRDLSKRTDGQIVTDSDEEVDTDEEGDGKELFDSAALAALLKAATNAESDDGSITITSQDGSRLFSVERPAGLGSSLRSLKPASRPNRSNLFTPSILTSGVESDDNLNEEEKKKLEKLQLIRVKFLRLVHRLGLSPDESIAAQVLYRLALVAGRQTGELFSLDAAMRTAVQLEAEGKDDLDFSVNILVLGKSGVGKSATINSIFGEEKALIHAFEPATTTVKEISGVVDGVKIRVFDTPGLKSSVMEQAFNRGILSSVKKFTKKSPPDNVLYVDRLDAQTRDLNDLPMLRTITSSLGSSIWRSAIVTLTHAASAPPDGPSGSPLSYEVFVSQRSHVVQQSIGQAVGDLRMMSPSLMNPVSLVENHSSCQKNRGGQKVLPNGQSWRPQLLLLCYSMKILAEASSLSKPQDPFDHRKLFGFRARSPPLPYMLSSMLQSRAHPKLSSEQGGENGDSDIDLADLSDSDQEDEEDEYDQLPPFKPLRKSQIAKLSKEQRKAYFEEYDYRVKLLQKKQWREELKRIREIKKKGKEAGNDYGYMEEDPDSAAAAPVAIPLPDMVLPPSFDGDNPAYRYRFLEPTSQFLARPVLDTHGWDHDCGYDGVSLEHSLAIASHFPASVALQITKDKKEFTINLDSSISAKHGENGSTMAGFDIQTIGKQLAYVIRGETKFKNLKKNKTAGGIAITFLGENVATGFKIEDQIVIGKQYVLAGSAGTVRSQHDAAYGANIELQRRELDYPIGQVQSTFGLSLIKWRGDLALGFNSLAQFSIGRSSKVAVRAGLNNKLSGQITVRTSSTEHLSLVLAGVIPTALAIYKKLWPEVGEKYSIY